MCLLDAPWAARVWYWTPPSAFLPLSDSCLRQGLSCWNGSFLLWLDWPASELWHCSCCQPPLRAGVTGVCQPTPRFYVRAGDPNSDPHPCVTWTLPTESSSEPSTLTFCCCCIWLCHLWCSQLSTMQLSVVCLLLYGPEFPVLHWFASTATLEVPHCLQGGGENQSKNTSCCSGFTKWLCPRQNRIRARKGLYSPKFILNERMPPSAMIDSLSPLLLTSPVQRASSSWTNALGERPRKCRG